MNKLLFVVFFLIIVISFILFNNYGKKISSSSRELFNQKIDKILYAFFSELIDFNLLKDNSINNILTIHKNSNGEILMVDYNLESTYKILTKVSNKLKNGIEDLENGKIDIMINDGYINGSDKGLILFIPLFLDNKNVFLNNLGPKIPVLVSFNETLLTNVKTKVTNYGLNNALLEVYITVEIQKLIITPFKKYNDKFNYELLISATVINGRVPEIYGLEYESGSGIIS